MYLLTDVMAFIFVMLFSILQIDHELALYGLILNVTIIPNKFWRKWTENNAPDCDVRYK